MTARNAERQVGPLRSWNRNDERCAPQQFDAVTLLRDISTCETRALGPPASTCSENEMHPEADILDLLLVELPVGRIPIQIVQQQLEIPTQHPHALELNAGSRRQVCSPSILLMVLDIEGGDRSDPPPQKVWGLRNSTPAWLPHGFRSDGS